MMHQSPQETRQSANTPAIYPDTPGVRKGAPSTSQEAADQIAPRLGPIQRLVRETIEGAGLEGMTAEELAARLELDRYTVQPRTSELKVKGLICDSGARRKNGSGKRAVVWISAEYAPKPEGVA